MASVRHVETAFWNANPLHGSDGSGHDRQGEGPAPLLPEGPELRGSTCKMRYNGLATTSPRELVRAALASTATTLCVLLLTSLAAGAMRQTAPPDTEPITPISEAGLSDTTKAALGEALFHDYRLSRGDRFACHSCHLLDEGGDDQRARPEGLDGQPLLFNAPTVFNAARNFQLNWRGNFRTIEEQNEAALLDPHVMGTSWDELLIKLRADPSYEAAFRAAYGASPERRSVLDALAEFQRSLVTPGASFDRYLQGQRGAITADAERGYRLFMAYGCIACHQGENVGGNLFQKFGIFANPFAEDTSDTEADLGRFTVTGGEADRHVFRVPSLRNVAVTAPYFHDGRTTSLAKAVETMARIQLGRELPMQDVRSIVAFLESLTGEYRGRSLAGNARRKQQ